MTLDTADSNVRAGTVAAIDIGTNSVRSLIVDARGGELERSMRITRLGQGVDERGALQPAAMERTLSVLSEYGASLRRYGVERARAVATSAARDASNGELFLNAVEQALGVRPELISGDEEARLSFNGAISGLSLEAGPFLVFDIGGGSTELVFGGSAPEAAISLQMGCVRMTERFLKSDPPAAGELQACRSEVQRLLAAVRGVMDPGKARLVVGLAGTVTSLAALNLGLERYDASRTHHSRLARSQVHALTQRLANVPVQARRQLLAEPARAEVIVGGALVLAGLLEELGIDELLVSERDILDGLASSLRLDA
jgi:exopolyphosphatase/guanosine-5'-triphosphate,3'-diphosphate pyrophosphatase